jgi:hypothetical protein
MKSSRSTDSLISDFIDGARNNSFGRRVNVELGPGLSASYKTAGAMEALQRLGIGGAAELAGLGLIAAPVAHQLATSGKAEEDPTTQKIHHTSDLAGLGLLASPYIMKLLGKGH